jgi:hypothetical protein
MFDWIGDALDNVYDGGNRSRLPQSRITMRTTGVGALKLSLRRTSTHAMTIHCRFSAKAQSAGGVFDVTVRHLVGTARGMGVGVV